MAYKSRKDEVEAMMEAIRDGEDLEEVAKIALATGFALMQRRNLWAVATDARLVYGVYAYESDARKAMDSMPTAGGQAAVIPLVGALAAEERWEESDLQAHRTAHRLCANCDHSLAGHGLTNRSSGCSVYGCRCSAPKKP